MADWESALDEPAREFFPKLRRAYWSVVCCPSVFNIYIFSAFHYAQSIIRNVGKANLIPEYRSGDNVVRGYVHCVSYLLIMDSCTYYHLN